MAKKKNAGKKSLPGTIYLNKNRYWWKVQLPGGPSPKRKAGIVYDSTSYGKAIEYAI